MSQSIIEQDALEDKRHKTVIKRSLKTWSTFNCIVFAVISQILRKPDQVSVTRIIILAKK